jgi:hypothetical protein
VCSSDLKRSVMVIEPVGKSVEEVNQNINYLLLR